MKICYFVTHYPYEKDYDDYFCGGVGVVAENLAKEMAKRGHEVLIFTTSRTRKYSFEERGGIKIHRYGACFRIAEAYMSFRLLFCPLKHEVDIVHAHIGNLPAPIAAYLYAKKRNKPFIVTYHEDWMGGFGSLARRLGIFLFDHYFADRLLSSADVILTPSRYYINESKFLRKYEDKVKAIPNGIHLEEFNVSHSKEECRTTLNLPLDKKIILFVGALTPRKAPHILVKAMKKIIEDVPDSYLVIVGAGKLKKELEGMTKKLGIHQKVRFVGFAEDCFKPLYYKSSDVFVLPSFSEGFGIVLLEASACELPLVVSNLEVFKSIIEEGKNGLFSETGDDVDIAKKIIYLLKNDNIREKMGENARKKVEGFSWVRIAEETEKVYNEVNS
jgi:glycosyltransferase involved in cell wall biosynthesis